MQYYKLPALILLLTLVFNQDCLSIDLLGEADNYLLFPREPERIPQFFRTLEASDEVMSSLPEAAEERKKKESILKATVWAVALNSEALIQSKVRVSSKLNELATITISERKHLETLDAIYCDLYNRMKKYGVEDLVSSYPLNLGWQETLRALYVIGQEEVDMFHYVKTQDLKPSAICRLIDVSMQKNFQAIIELLLDLPREQTTRQGRIDRAFIRAASNKEIEMVEFLFGRPEGFCPTAEGINEAFRQAGFENHQDVMKFLISQPEGKRPHRNVIIEAYHEAVACHYSGTINLLAPHVPEEERVLQDTPPS